MFQATVTQWLPLERRLTQLAKPQISCNDKHSGSSATMWLEDHLQIDTVHVQSVVLTNDHL